MVVLRNAKNAVKARAHAAGRQRARSSFIRTVTVGSGIGPDLLTLRLAQALAGSSLRDLPPVGTSTPP